MSPNETAVEPEISEQGKLAAETFDKYLKNSMPEEYPAWVNDVLITIGDGKVQRLAKYEVWVTEVYEANKNMKPAHADSK